MSSDAARERRGPAGRGATDGPPGAGERRRRPGPAAWVIVTTFVAALTVLPPASWTTTTGCVAHGDAGRPAARLRPEGEPRRRPDRDRERAARARGDARPGRPRVYPAPARSIRQPANVATPATAVATADGRAGEGGAGRARARRDGEGDRERRAGDEVAARVAHLDHGLDPERAAAGPARGPGRDDERGRGAHGDVERGRAHAREPGAPTRPACTRCPRGPPCSRRTWPPPRPPPWPCPPAQASAAPGVPVPGTRARVTVALVAARLPYASSTRTTGCAAQATPPRPAAGLGPERERRGRGRGHREARRGRGREARGRGDEGVPGARPVDRAARERRVPPAAAATGPPAQARVPPPGLVPTARVTGSVAPATVLPPASATATSGWAAQAAPAVPPPGRSRTRSRAAGPVATANGVEVAAARPGPGRPTWYPVPARSIVQPANVATPATAARREAARAREHRPAVPVPAAIESVTARRRGRRVAARVEQAHHRLGRPRPCRRCRRRAGP